MVKRAGVEGRVSLRNSLLSFSSRALKQRKADVQNEAIVAGIIGKNTGQNIIATVPSSLSPGKVGRIWTGAMYRDFDATVDQVGTKIILKFGWVKRKQKYYAVQENGGFAFGKSIVPMHAIAAATIAADNHLKSKGIK